MFINDVNCSSKDISLIVLLPTPGLRPLLVRTRRNHLVSWGEREKERERGREMSLHPSTGPSNSSWCLLIEQLLIYAKSTPNAFLSGIMLLSELLPLPLPVHSPKVKTCTQNESKLTS